MSSKDFSKATITGRLTRDPDITQQKGGTLRANFGIAVNNAYKKDKVDFVDCVAWGKPAEIIGEHCGKGSRLLISGPLVQSRWETGGQKRSKLEIKVDDFVFLSDKGEMSPATTPENADQNEEEDDDVPF